MKTTAEVLGYPDGLRGDEIPSLAQIISVVDTYDAITTTGLTGQDGRIALDPIRWTV